MKKIFVSMTVGVAAIAAAACSSGSKSGGKSVSSGNYIESTGGFSSDQCGFAAAGSTSNYDATAGGVAKATVTKPGADGANSFDFGAQDNTGASLYSETYDITGTALHDPNSPGVRTFDCTQLVNTTTNTYACATHHPYTCSEQLDVEYNGVITGSNAFTVNDSFAFGNTTGATACAAAVLTSTMAGGGFAAYPCTTVDSGSFHK